MAGSPPPPRIPVATYRLQFNRLFRFADAVKVIPYLKRLGISDIYSSPYLKARPESLHGYDIIDPESLNPEVGSEKEYRAMAAELSRQGMGQILDIVPNHMGISDSNNRWWNDVLENGPGARHAPHFDINWHPVKQELENRILLPVLGDQYGNVLDRGELRLLFEDGAFFITYYEHCFPLRPLSYLQVLGYRLERGQRLFPPEHPDLLEYLSIITAIRHLPLYTDIDPESIAERYREKEVIKRRIAALYRSSAPIRRFLDRNVAIFNGIPGRSDSFDLLDRLLSAQIYRLAYWRVATEEINYRRFFDIHELAALRSELPQVFADCHRLVLRLVREGAVTGLRVDHPDGLYDPVAYFRTLQEECFIQRGLGLAERELERPFSVEEERSEEERLRMEYRRLLEEEPQYLPFYVVGEKILVRDERVPAGWPIFSTTGYSFLNAVNGIFVNRENGPRFEAIYASFIGMHTTYRRVVYDNKKLIMMNMASEINTLGHYLDRISEKDRHTRDFTLNNLRQAITEVIAVFPVYRTYITAAGVSEVDQGRIETAVEEAKRLNPTMSPSVFDFLRDVLLLRHPFWLSERDRGERLDFVMKFQQLTGPFMAKGVEDTAFYVYNPLVSLNEVGGSPDCFGTTVEEFHAKNLETCRERPHSLIATSTHDSKRGEDVRTRIDVLSEIPDEWEVAIRRWSTANDPLRCMVDEKPVPDRNEEYLLYQTLLGISPSGPMDEASFEIFRQRLKDYMLKAAREAKISTSWINPNERYERALMDFIDALIARQPDNAFLYDFEQFIRRVEPYGLLNSLSQLLLKITSPGVPDFYQGTELWNFRLVDPDNRWPVDFDKRMRLLDELQRQETEARSDRIGFCRELSMNAKDGRIKLYVTWKGLAFRGAHAELYAGGEYVPLEAAGERSTNVVAFERRLGEMSAVTIAPRFFTRLGDHPDTLFQGDDPWRETFVLLRNAPPESRYRNIFTGEETRTLSHRMGGIVYLCEVMTNFPVALLERIS